MIIELVLLLLFGICWKCKFLNFFRFIELETLVAGFSGLCFLGDFVYEGRVLSVWVFSFGGRFLLFGSFRKKNSGSVRF